MLLLIQSGIVIEFPILLNQIDSWIYYRYQNRLELLTFKKKGAIILTHKKLLLVYLTDTLCNKCCYRSANRRIHF